MNVIFFGDSICFGAKSSPHKIWVNKLSVFIEEKFGNSYTVINSSINGNTTRMALERMPFDVQEPGVTILILQFGMNDCNYWQTDQDLPRVSPNSFVSNLHEIIDRAKKFGAKKILLNTNHPTTRYTPFQHTGISYEESNIAYNNLIRKVATDMIRKDDTILVDIEMAFRNEISRGTSSEKLLLDDGLHLGVRGHELYYNVVNPFLYEVCKQLIE